MGHDFHIGHGQYAVHLEQVLERFGPGRRAVVAFIAFEQRHQVMIRSTRRTGSHAVPARDAVLGYFPEVVVGAHVVYMSADGKYMFQGELIDLKNRQSLTEPRRREVYKVALETLGEDKMIVFSPEKTKHSVTVFTDVDCGYCRKLHAEMDQYMQAGIEIRYLFFPRAGIGSESYKKAVAAWCSDDRQQALTDSKKGKPIPMKTCDNPIGEHMEMAQLMGLRGTPFIILESGEVKPGYVPAKQLSLLLDQPAQR